MKYIVLLGVFLSAVANAGPGIGTGKVLGLIPYHKGSAEMFLSILKTHQGQNLSREGVILQKDLL